MKKVILSAVLATSMLYSANNAYEFGVNGGVTSVKNDGGLNLENGTVGLTFMKNREGLKPRMDFEYVRIDENEVQVSSLFKGSLNGVYEFLPDSNFFPYILAGVGYEVVSDAVKTDGEEFESNAFVQGGLGVGYRFPSNKVVLRAEAKLLQIVGGEKDENNEVVAVLGLGIPFGVIPDPVPPKLEIKDSDGDGVMDELDKCPDTPPGVAVDGSGCPLPEPKIIKEAIPLSFDNNECPVKIDLPDRDRDGVEDSLDQCPNTPCDFTVDSKGCPVKANLRIHFETDKARITAHSRPLVEKFADFLVTNKGSLVHIVGHTDWRGSDNYNMVLSKKRAQSVRDALIELGVSASRLSTEGKGETEPMATNKTDEGMALNRRIEVKLTYPQEINQGGEQ